MRCLPWFQCPQWHIQYFSSFYSLLGSCFNGILPHLITSSAGLPKSTVTFPSNKYNPEPRNGYLANDSGKCTVSKKSPLASKNVPNFMSALLFVRELLSVTKSPTIRITFPSYWFISEANASPLKSDFAKSNKELETGKPMSSISS